LATNLVDVAWRDSHGNLWFGTHRGISRLAPLREPPPPIPVPWITAVHVDGVPQRVSELGAPRVSGLKLVSGQNRVEIDFLALTSAPGESVAYQYRMEGLDRDWSPVSTARSVMYAHLPPGRFRFLVRAIAFEDQVIGPDTAEVLLVVQPQVWRRIGWLALAALVLGGGVYALYRYRVAGLVAIEQMRTRIATDLHDDLGSSLSRISILSEVARRRAEGDPEGMRLLNDIGEAAREMMESLGENIWSIDPRRDNLRSLVTRIRRFASDLLESRGVAWTMQAPPAPELVKLSPVERRHLYLIFKEAIHNVARHSGASAVSLSIAVAGHRLTAVMKDNGKGFVAPQATESVGRHGLPSMVARAAQLGGVLWIESTPGSGTEIRLDVPLSGGNA
jgi:signal transduction histidine kinase